MAILTVHSVVFLIPLPKKYKVCIWPKPIPVAARKKTSKAWTCCRSLAGIAGSNPHGDMNVSLFEVLLGRGLCFVLVTRPEESYRV